MTKHYVPRSTMMIPNTSLSPPWYDPTMNECVSSVGFNGTYNRTLTSCGAPAVHTTSAASHAQPSSSPW